MEPVLTPPDATTGRVVRVGVDIGKLQDYTAFVVTDEQPGPGGDPFHFVRDIYRAPLGTSYPVIADTIARVMFELQTRARRWLQPDAYRLELVLDATGVGQPVVDLVKERGYDPIEVTLTGSDKITRDGLAMSVGKAALVSRLQVLLQSGRLRIPATDMGRIVANELRDYEIKVSDSGHARFIARSGAHDDLVIAIGLSVGFGNHMALRLDDESAFPAIDTPSRTAMREMRRRRADRHALEIGWPGWSYDDDWL